MKIFWNANIQPHHREMVETILTELKWMIPGWVLEISVNVWNSDDAEKMLSVETNYAYRFVRLNVYTNWFNQGEAEQLRQMIHEMIHIPITPVVMFAEEALKATMEGSQQGAVILNEMHDRHESATCDITEAIYRKVYAADVRWAGH